MISTEIIDNYDSIIANPLTYVDRIFSKAESPLESTATDWGEETFLREVADRVKDRLSTIGHGLIRICGMITESKGSEFYSGVYRHPEAQTIVSGKFRDTFAYDHCDPHSHRIFSREVFVVSEIPGLSSWTRSTNPFLTCKRLYLKVMDSMEKPKLGHLVDVIGILSTESPTVIHQVWSQDCTFFPMEKPISDLLSVRGDLIQFLAYALGNDYTAAQYILLHMLSRVHGRIPDQSVIIGNLPLHVRPLMEGTARLVAQRIREIYSLLLPCTASFDVSLEALSSSQPINPKMDYESDELVSGPLHLAPGTALILDQSKLEPGKLESSAFQNLKTLQRIAKFQLLAFDFMYEVDFATDIPVVVIAEEKSTLVPTQYCIEVGGVDRLPEYVDYRIDDDILDSWRQYISNARRATVHLSEDMSTKARQDFIDNRFKMEQMHRVLNLARLLSSSFFEPEITKSTWNSAISLEKKQADNLSANSS